MLKRLATLCTLASATALAQTTLPPNYKTVIDNPTFLVQRVHYGAHEFIPMHDHYPVVTVLVYLNDSGVVEIAHQDGEIIKRPPTHTGAFRIGPAAFERHSIHNLGDVPSDFFRVELKTLPLDWLKQQVRGPAPTPPLQPGLTTEYKDARIRIDRIVCAANVKCTVPADPAPSILITIPTPIQLAKQQRLASSMPPNRPMVIYNVPQAQYLRVLVQPQP